MSSGSNSCCKRSLRARQHHHTTCTTAAIVFHPRNLDRNDADRDDASNRSPNYWPSSLCGTVRLSPHDQESSSTDATNSAVARVGPSPATEEEDGASLSLCSISYAVLSDITRATCQALSLSLLSQQQVGVGGEHQRQQPVVAISIPEGPYLAIAVLVVHTLTATSRRTAPAASAAIILPLDPEEGKDRLEHMLVEARPTVVLTLQGKDMERIQDAVVSSTLKKKNEDGVCTVKVVDFASFVEHALLTYCHHTTNNHDQKQYNASPIFNNSSSNFDPLPPVMPHCSSCSTSSLDSSCENNTNHNSSRSSSTASTATIQQHNADNNHRISHIVYTSGTTGMPKGCVSSLRSLRHYVAAKNKAHDIAVTTTHTPRVLLASALSFDPCLSDILATFYAGSTLALAPRRQLYGGTSSSLRGVLRELRVTHVLCTPTLWSTTMTTTTTIEQQERLPDLRVVALGGEPIPSHIVSSWAKQRRQPEDHKSYHEDRTTRDGDNRNARTTVMQGSVRLLATYGVTEACVYQTVGEVFNDIPPTTTTTTAGDRAFIQDNQTVRTKRCRKNIHDLGSSTANNRDVLLFSDRRVPVGQDVGVPLEGSNIHIWKERPQLALGTKSNTCMHGIISSSKSSHHQADDDDDDRMVLVEKAGEPSLKYAPNNNETNDDDDDNNTPTVGEIVISGVQVDCYSGYLKRPQLTQHHFVSDDDRSEQQGERPSDTSSTKTTYFYRTGDRGYLHPRTGHLHILGRIHGEEGMVKINGIRVEMGEIEAGILDSSSHDEFAITYDNTTSSEHRSKYHASVVSECVVIVTSKDKHDSSSKQLIAYVVLSKRCSDEVGIAASSFMLSEQQPEKRKLPHHKMIDSTTGIICSPGPLLVLLRTRCKNRVRKGCIPFAFVIVNKMPMTSTGKRNRKALPPIDSCIALSSCTTATLHMSTSVSATTIVPLWEYGATGPAVAAEVIACLNLQSNSLKSMVSTRVSFPMLGGDSLAAIRVTRALYALHHGILDSRTLGGPQGTLDGPFDVIHLLRAKTLRDYVDFLDEHKILLSRPKKLFRKKVDDGDDRGDANMNPMKSDQTDVEDCNTKAGVSNTDSKSLILTARQTASADTVLFNALVETIILGHTVVALGLLAQGADPNYKEHGKRFAKITGRNERRVAFRSNPLHLACANGNSVLVQALLQKECKSMSPNASGMFPIHLACTSTGRYRTVDQNNNEYNMKCRVMEQEDIHRTECVRLLLDVGKVPLTIKDGSKQTVLHAAARSGHCNLLSFLLERWAKDKKCAKPVTSWGASKFDWQDRWFRTPVHWAVLNGNVGALTILLSGGRCSANPPKPNTGVSNRVTSGAIESPLEICERLYRIDHGVGNCIYKLLNP